MAAFWELAEAWAVPAVPAVKEGAIGALTSRYSSRASTAGVISPRVNTSPP
jgi:hypothetical protein